MARVYLIPGLGESGLASTNALDRRGYPTPSTIMLGQTRILTLAPNGTDPGPPYGIELVAAGGLAYYITTPLSALQVQYGLSGPRVTVYAWDWRKQLYPTGQHLAAIIRANEDPDDPCTLVGHSAGGLIARAAWTDLGTTGDQARVRRIVTLGTPHWGSYAAVQFFQGFSNAIDVLKYWNITVGGSVAGWNPSITGYVALETIDYQLMAMTWPALYEVLPVLGAPSASDDPLRVLLYDNRNWAVEARPQQAWLDYARDVTGPWLRSAASQPPPAVLTCVAGTGFTCPTRIESQQGFDEGDGLGGAGDGDGTVAGVDAIISGSTAYEYVLEHANIMVALALNGELRKLIDQVNPTPAPPPALASTIIAPNYVQPIPASAIPTLSPVTVPSCSGGVCSC